ncbi:MAG: sigma-70 family RNA polymerase sigma factor [Isosphaeraceae bacterium]
MGPSAEDILARISAGDASALGILFDRYAGRVLGLLLNYVGREDAEDLLQVVFHEVWDRASAFDPSRSRFETWLLLIARSRALDHLRKRRIDAEPLDPSGPASDRDPSGEAERSEQVGRLRSALGMLPDDQRRAIELAFFSRLTHQEIALRVGTPLGTVKTRIRLGMSRLRVMLEDGELSPVGK